MNTIDTAAGQVLALLSQRYGCTLESEYYDRIRMWEAWWRGYYKPFHCYREQGFDGRLLERRLFSMGMAKKVCEDWAAILLNEKTTITVDNAASQKFLCGEEAAQGTGGVLGANGFWSRGNALVEKAFALGEGAFVLRLKNARVDRKGRLQSDTGTAVHIEYVPATGIIPLSSQGGRITGAAFLSEWVKKGAAHLYLETHLLENGEYVVQNEFFCMKDGTLSPEPLPGGVPARFYTGSGRPWFALIHPNTVNNILHNNGMGMSVFANALDCLMGVDLAYNNFCRDFKLGGKKVFYSKEMLSQDERGRKLTPDDVAQQLFLMVGADFSFDEKQFVQEFNPSLRVAENREGVQAQLDYLSFRCGLGARHYQFNVDTGRIMTATEYVGGRQDLVQNASKHYIVVEQALLTLVGTILYAGRTFCGAQVDENAAVAVHFEDSYIVDKETERARDAQEVRDGLLLPWEFRVRWYGEDEETAKARLGEAQAAQQWFEA